MQDNMEYLIQNEQGSQKKKSDEGSSTPTRCVWNLLTIFVVLNTMISIALLGITIAFVTRVTKTVETSAQGIVPGTIFPSLIAAAQANLDPKSWKEIFDSSAKEVFLLYPQMLPIQITVKTTVLITVNQNISGCSSISHSIDSQYCL